MSETNGFWEGDWRVYKIPTDINDRNSEFPNKFSLSQNYPNPFNPSTTINYSIPLIANRESQVVLLNIYDMLGQKVATLVNKTQKAGNYEVVFNVSNLTSGTYFYRLTAGDFSKTMKFILLK